MLFYICERLERITMMISPKAYYDLYLKDKSENEILKVIKRLKREINSLIFESLL